METVLQMTGVVKRYGRKTALDGLNLSVKRGSIFGLVGSNGAGKTTTMCVAAGLVRTTSGAVSLFGGGGYDPSLHAGVVSMMPQDSDLPRDARVRDLLVFYAELQGMSRKQAETSVVGVMEMVNLADQMDSVVRTLSHGMRRRVVFAQAFLGDPELVILDEPTSGLDPVEVVNVRNMLIKMRGRKTVIISSHNLHEIERMCDTVAFIERGKTIRQDEMRTLVGHNSLLNYRICNWRGGLDELNGLAQGIKFEVGSGSEGDDSTCVIACSFDDGMHPVAEVNRLVLGYFLKVGVGVLSVRSGEELEKIYMDDRG